MPAISPTDRVFVLTGAGISAESGIPTFRGVDGLWRNYRIEEVASPIAWQNDPQLVWEFYSMRRRVASAAKPNPAHLALAKVEKELGERLFVCTQNVDNLHEQAGWKNVVHMHGELFKSRCDRKQRRRWSVAHKQQIVEETLVPGVSVAAVARAHGMNANQVFEWRRLHESGQLVERRARRLQPSMPRLLPVSVSEGEPVAYAAAGWIGRPISVRC